MRKFKFIVATAALVAALAVPAASSAQTSLTPDTWFTPAFSTPGDGTTLGFLAASFLATTTTLWATDYQVVGDIYEIWANGINLGATGGFVAGTPNESDPETAFWSGLFSKRVYSVGVGDLITINHLATPAGYSGGNMGLKSVTVPEPASALLIVGGLLTMGFVSRRRQGIVETA